MNNKLYVIELNFLLSLTCTSHIHIYVYGMGEMYIKIGENCPVVFEGCL